MRIEKKKMDTAYVSGFLVTDETDGSDSGAPPLELIHPVGQGGLGHQDHVRTRNVAQVFHVAQEGDGLQGLAQAHLVGQNSVDAVLVEGDHPIETTDLAGSSTSRKQK